MKHLKTTATILAIALLGSTATSAMAQQTAQPNVIESANGKCHDSSTAWYAGMIERKSFVASYDTLEACEAAGGTIARQGGIATTASTDADTTQ